MYVLHNITMLYMYTFKNGLVYTNSVIITLSRCSLTTQMELNFHKFIIIGLKKGITIIYFQYILQTYVTRSGKTVGATSYSLSRNQQCRLFDTITQGNRIYKPWNSLSITKAYLDYYKRSYS